MEAEETPQAFQQLLQAWEEAKERDARLGTGDYYSRPAWTPILHYAMEHTQVRARVEELDPYPYVDQFGKTWQRNWG